MRVREAHNSFSWKGHGIGLRVKGDQMRVPLKPTPDLIFFRLRLVGIYPVLEDSDFRNGEGGICAPEDLPLRQSSYPSRMKDLPRPRRLGRGGI
jgi:hypothetical protein